MQDVEETLLAIGFRQEGFGLIQHIDLPTGRLELTATRSATWTGQPAVVVTTLLNTHRQMGTHTFEMPVQCRSEQEVLAYLAYGLSRQRKYLLDADVDWFRRGLEHLPELPFLQEREQRQERYRKRPQCSVDRDWLGVLRRQIREALTDDNEEPIECVRVSFDGELMRFEFAGKALKCPAEGIAWSECFYVDPSLVESFPIRFMRNPAEVSVWDGRFRIGNVAYPLTETEDCADD